MGCDRGYRVSGKILFVNGSTVYRSRGCLIEVSHDDGLSWSRFHVVNVNLFQRLLMSSHLLTRALRLGVHHFVPCNDGFFVMVNKVVYRITNKGMVNGETLPYVGGRPLCIFSDGHSLYYGEYVSNPERNPVSIYSYDGSENNQIHSIQGVRHIHGVFESPIGERWVTTGDYLKEAAIWSWGASGVQPLLAGDQQARAVQILFKDEYIYYGTDTPLEKNFIRRLDPLNGQVESLCGVGSSVFYGCSLGDFVFFSTVIEPSEANPTRHAELWFSKNGEVWRIFEKRKKDIWPMKIFQYGQIVFPRFKGQSNYLWYFVQGLTGSGYSYRVDLDEVQSLSYRDLSSASRDH